MGDSGGRRRFDTLDGLRGVAAVVVLLYHLSPAWPWLPFPKSAYLSVDLFFMLSGFVIGYSYHDRLAAGLSFRRFFKLRLVRLYPLYLLASLLGLATAAAIALQTGEWWRARPAADALPWALVMLPDPGVHWTPSFTLNPPAWSLTFEMLVCILYGALFPWLGTRALVGILAASAVLFMATSIHTGSVNVAPTGWWGLFGLARPIFSFTAGLLLHRCHRSGALRVPAIRAEAAVALFLALLLVPADGPLAGVLSAATVVIGFPIVMIIGITAAPAPRLVPAMATAGDLSYPLYALHWPVMMAVAAIGGTIGADAAVTHAALVPIAIAAAWAAARWYDRPIRTWVRERAARDLPLRRRRRRRPHDAVIRLPDASVVNSMFQSGTRAHK